MNRALSVFLEPALMISTIDTNTKIAISMMPSTTPVRVEMAMPREFHVLIQQLHESVTRADALCEEGLLLTLASPPELRSLRAWMTHEIVAQATQGARPVPWHEWLRRSTG